ncbi:MAG: hypothetical protein ACOX2T_03225 [bacterium]|jgi:hypothetical protein
MKEQLRTRNEYGVRDLTPYNAANRMSGSGTAISFGGIRFDSPEQLKYSLTPADVINRCAELGLEIGERKLQRRTEAGLVTKPYRKGAGRGYGTISLYRADAPAELFASEVLMQKLKLRRNVARAAEIRALAVTEDKQNFWRHVFDSPDNLPAAAWLAYYAGALKQNMPVTVIWKTEGAIQGIRKITLELLPVLRFNSVTSTTEDWMEEYKEFDWMGVYSPTTIKEEDDPAKFAEWEDITKKLETR